MSKFTAKEDFMHGRAKFEAGNTYDSEKQGLSDADVNIFYNAGWAEVEGRDPAPERQPGAVAIQPEGTVHG